MNFESDKMLKNGSEYAHFDCISSTNTAWDKNQHSMRLEKPLFSSTALILEIDIPPNASYPTGRI